MGMGIASRSEAHAHFFCNSGAAAMAGKNRYLPPFLDASAPID
jgi:hypothetical protein